MPNSPVAYFITFRTNGTWLPGDERTWVDDEHNLPDSPTIQGRTALARFSAHSLQHAPVELDATARSVVESAIRGVRAYRGWTLHVCAVRTNDVHVIATADATPERMMNTFKSWGTRRLIEAGRMKVGARVWSLHGSTRWLNDDGSLRAACAYVAEGQDVPR